MFPNAWDGKFPGFLGEISGSREMAFGNADLYYGDMVATRLLLVIVY